MDTLPPPLEQSTLGTSDVKSQDTRAHKKTLFILSTSMGLIFIFMLIEFFGGLISGSMALISDSAHMLSDFISLILALMGVVISKRGNNLAKTYGYKRFEIIIGFTNALFLVFLCFMIVYEAISRLFYANEVNTLIMIPVAVSGLIINFVVLGLFQLDKNAGQFHGHSHHSNSHGAAHTHSQSHAHYDKDHHNHGLNDASAPVSGKQKKIKPKTRSLLMEGAFLHVLSDTLGSLAAITAGIVIYYTNWAYIDPILSIFIVSLIANSTWKILKESFHILMEGSPRHINAANIKSELEKNIESVINIHHIHLWMLNEQENLLTLHAIIQKDKNIASTLNEIKLFVLNR
ncbi:Cation transporter [Candidatus Hepatincolaceae symbiont of Richtersius coronifer]